MKYRLYTDTEKSMETGRHRNEDRYLFSEFSFMEDQKIQLIVIADGMGGLQNGAETAGCAVKYFAQSFYSEILSNYTESDMKSFSARYAINAIESAMIEAVKEANRKVCERAKAYDNTGTTLSAICIVNEFAVIANIGDSPIYYYNNKRRKLSLISELHTKAEQDVQLGIYARFSDEYYRNDSKLYRYIGQYSELNNDEISVTSIGNLSDGDIIIAGTDGCFGRIRENVLFELLSDSSADDEGFVISQLFDIARLDGYDDQTAVMYIVEDN